MISISCIFFLAWLEFLNQIFAVQPQLICSAIIFCAMCIQQSATILQPSP